MKYALLVYHGSGSFAELLADDRRTLHDPELYRTIDLGSTRVLAHYRLRAPGLTTAIRQVGDEIIRSEGPAIEAGETLRALFLLEGEDAEAVLDLAARLPAVRLGGVVEVWPLIEPEGHRGRRHGFRRRVRHDRTD
jgi:hypothetical protein